MVDGLEIRDWKSEVGIKAFHGIHVSLPSDVIPGIAPESIGYCSGTNLMHSSRTLRAMSFQTPIWNPGRLLSALNLMVFAVHPSSDIIPGIVHKN